MAKTCGERLGVVDDRLAQAGVGGIGGELLEAIEELADKALQAAAGSFVEERLNLIETGRKGVELALALSFLIEAKLQDVVANALDAAEIYAGSELEVANGIGGSFDEIGDFASVAGRVDVGDVVADDGESALLGDERADGDVEAGSEAHGREVSNACGATGRDSGTAGRTMGWG